MFLDQDGSVYICGSNKYGQLGLGHTNFVGIPTKIEGLPQIDHLGTPKKKIIYHKNARNAMLKKSCNNHCMMI